LKIANRRVRKAQIEPWSLLEIAGYASNLRQKTGSEASTWYIESVVPTIVGHSSARGASDHPNTRFWCEKWKARDGVLMIRGVHRYIDMASGVTRQCRISYVDECHLGGSIAIMTTRVRDVDKVCCGCFL
jgi:hypothetical protein